MKKISKDKKEWLDRHSRKGQRVRFNRSGHKHKKNSNYRKTGTGKIPVQVEIISIAFPPDFSLKRDYYASISCFEEISKQEYKSHPNRLIELDFSQTIAFDIESLIYLIAILERIKESPSCKIRVVPPENEIIKDQLINTGFTELAESSCRLPEYWDNRERKPFRIARGTLVDSELVNAISLYTKDLLSLSSRRVRPLYEMLIEMMSNTVSHSASQHWYIYAERIGLKKLRFVFFDTGRGIPNTVRLNFRENILRFFGGQKIVSDAELIQSALEGNFRTRTNEAFRGKGLPQIAKTLRADHISCGAVNSGQGRCEIGINSSKEPVYAAQSYDREFQGTLYYWEVSSNTVKIPIDFSLKRSYNDSISCFNEIERWEQEMCSGNVYNLDFSQVTKFDIEPLLYVLAKLDILKESRHCKIQVIHPETAEIEKQLTDTGFIELAERNAQIPDEWKSKGEKLFRITRGDLVDSRLVDKVCIFTGDFLGLPEKSISPLYNMLIEMMINKVKHSRSRYWYLYPEKTDGKKLKFNFFDTGRGIADSVKEKNWKDIQDLFVDPKNTGDAEVIQSALKGNLEGQGLPQIAECLNADYISCGTVNSGRGRCKIGIMPSGEPVYTIQNHTKKFHGTMFTWEMSPADIKKNTEYREVLV